MKWQVRKLERERRRLRQVGGLIETAVGAWGGDGWLRGAMRVDEGEGARYFLQGPNFLPS